MPLKSRSEMIWRLIGNRRAPRVGTWRHRQQAKADLNIGTGQRLDVCIFEKEAQEMQDVLARSIPPFYRRTN
jgi:hypothetical protein